MLTKETFVEIHVRFAQGQSIRKIAKELNISRNTVKRHLSKNQMPVYERQVKLIKKLTPFEQYLLERISHASPDWIPVTVLFDEIKKRGYQGGIAQLRRFVSQYKPKKINGPIIRFETEPGQQMQIDFTIIRRGKRPLKAFVATLGHSRATFVKFFDNERHTAWLEGIQQAIEFFGGVPRELLCDNPKTLMIQRDAYGESHHKLHPGILQMSKDYGFKLRFCQPYRAQTKGKVERFNHYLKNSFIVPLKATLAPLGIELDVEMANAKIGPWLSEIANRRVHATTQKIPTDELIKEVEFLLPLPRIISNIIVEETKSSIHIVPPIQHSMDVYQALCEVN